MDPHAQALQHLEDIAHPHECGCSPCMGACISKEILQDQLDESRRLAKACIHLLTTKGTPMPAPPPPGITLSKVDTQRCLKEGLLPLGTLVRWVRNEGAQRGTNPITINNSNEGFTHKVGGNWSSIESITLPAGMPNPCNPKSTPTEWHAITPLGRGQGSGCGGSDLKPFLQPLGFRPGDLVEYRQQGGGPKTGYITERNASQPYAFTWDIDQSTNATVSHIRLITPSNEEPAASSHTPAATQESSPMRMIIQTVYATSPTTTPEGKPGPTKEVILDGPTLIALPNSETQLGVQEWLMAGSNFAKFKESGCTPGTLRIAYAEPPQSEPLKV